MPDINTLLILGSLNALYAWSMWLPLASGQISFGTAGAAATGGYALAWLDLHTSLGLVVRLVAATLAGAATLGLAGIVGRRVKGFALGVVTLGMSEIIVIGIALVPGLGGPIGLSGLELVDDAQTVAVAAVVLVLLGSWVVYRDRLGRELDAVATSELHAAALGLRTSLISIGTFAVAGAAAGLAGGLSVAYAGFVDPSVFRLSLNVTAFSAVIIGGMGVFYGPVFGAFLLTALVNSDIVQGNQDLVIGVVLVVAVLVRRQGILQRSVRLQRRRVAKKVKLVHSRTSSAQA